MVQIISDMQLDYSDVLIAPQTTSINHRGEVDVVRQFKNIDLKCCPIMSSNMTQTGCFKVARSLVKNDMLGAIHKFYSAFDIIKFFEENGDSNNYFVTIGLRNKEFEIQRLREISKFNFSIMIDVPNAYIPEVELLVKEVRKEFPKRIIAVGNVCTGDRTQELIRAGANATKIGVGPSVICNTRITTGCGRPQLSSVIECANAAHQVGGYVIADGGFSNVGDICKALVAGADICMSGSFFAGCDESSGEIIEKTFRTNEVDTESLSYCSKMETKKFKDYYGMSSFRAQQENYGEKTKTGTSEGVESKLIPYTGPIIDTINQIKGGIRSCGSYIGAKNIKYFSRQGSFYKVNRIK